MRQEVFTDMNDEKDPKLNNNFKMLRIYIYFLIGILAVTSVVQFFSTLANIFSLEHAYLFSPAVILLLFTMFVWVGFFALVIIDKKRYIQRWQHRLNKVRSFFKTEEKDDTEGLTMQYNIGTYFYGTAAFALFVLGLVLTIIYLSRYGDDYFTQEWPILQTQAIVTAIIWAVCLLGYIPYIRKIEGKRLKRDIVIPIYLLTGVFIQNIAFYVSRMGQIY